MVETHPGCHSHPVPRGSTYWRMLGYLLPHRTAVGVSLCASAVAAGAAAAYAYLAGPLLKALLAGSAVELGLVSLDRKDLTLWLPLMVGAVATAKALAQYLHGGLTSAVGQRVMAALRKELYARLLALPPGFFARRHSGELLSRFTADVAVVESAVAQALTSYVKDSLQVLALLAVCARIDLRLFALAFLVLPAAAFPVARFARSLRRVARGSQASLGRLTELLAEQVHNLAVVQAFRGESRALQRFDQEQEQYLKAMRRSLLLRGGFTPVLELLGITGVALVVAVGARAVRAEPELAGRLLSFLAAALLIYQPLKALVGTLSATAQGLGAAERLFEIADQPVPPEEGELARPLQRSLRLSGVRVSYQGGREALRGLTLTVPAGKTVALVGHSGAGKSTLFSLLLGFVEAGDGEVLWDGVALSQLQPSSVRAQVAWVPQEPVLFSGSVRHNLLLGRPEAREEELWEALRRAHADGFVRAFPAGLEEPVGERGQKLSGGQRQRLAIARAFLREPSLLLLDEPTSSLDAASEREVQAGLAELMRGRTALIIAHRLSTVREADQIYVLEEGAVVEEGTHQELVRRGGRYAALLASGERAA